jgi:phospholipid transport system transporter-binding protein
MLTVESLTFQNAREVLEQGCAAVRSGDTVIDLANIKTADSSAVAVLLAWQRSATSAGAKLTYLNLPPSLQSLAALYGVEAFLHLEHHHH